MKENADLNSLFYPRWSDSCIWKPQEQGLFILRISQEYPEGESSSPSHVMNHIVLNEEGKDTWMLCTGENTVEEVVTTLQERYEGEFQAIFSDVAEMISLLLKENFLTLEESPCPVSPPLDESVHIKRSDTIIAQVIEDNFVVMNMNTSEVHSFEKDTSTLWELCDGTHTVGDIMSQAANPEDTLFLLNFLVRLGMVETADG